jgi:hypothetical protein
MHFGRGRMFVRYTARENLAKDQLVFQAPDQRRKSRYADDANDSNGSYCITT